MRFVVWAKNNLYLALSARPRKSEDSVISVRVIIEVLESLTIRTKSEFMPPYEAIVFLFSDVHSQKLGKQGRVSRLTAEID